ERANRFLVLSQGLLALWPLPTVPVVPATQVRARIAGFVILRDIVTNGMRQANLVLADVAELHALRGLLALERGDTIAAAAQFQAALDLSGNFLSRAIVDGYRGWLKRYREK